MTAGTLLRVAVRLAVTRSPEHAWRRVAVPVAAFVFTTSVILVAGIFLTAQRQESRDLARSLEFSSTPRATDAFTRTAVDIWRGRRITIVWVEPAGPRVSDTVLPPGMSTFPRPGEAVVSPALARLADQYPGLRSRFPHREVLGYRGVRTGGELLAYVRPVPGRVIGGEDEAVHVEGGELVGRDLYRVSRIGPVAPLGDDLPRAQLLAGVLACLVIPSVMVLGAGLATTSRTRDHRLQVLRGLGAGRGALVTLAVLEACVLAVPAIVVACVVSAAWSARASAVPFLALPLVPGDLALPWRLWVPTFVAVAAVVVLVAAVVARTGRLERAATRPVTERTESSWLSIVPLASSATAFAAATLAPPQSELAGNAQLAGVVLAAIGIPLVVPTCLRAVGSALGSSPRVVPALVGRSLAWDPTRAARPFAGVAALLVVAFALSGVYAIGESVVDEYRASAAPAGGVRDVNLVGVAWDEPEGGDVERLAAVLPAASVLPYRIEQGHGSESDEGDHGHEHGGVLVLTATCDDLSRHLGDLGCRSPDDVPDSVVGDLSMASGRALGHAIQGVRLDPASSSAPEPDDSVLVLGRDALTALDEDVRDAAYRTLPAPQVGSDIRRLYPPEQPVYGWILLGLGTAFVLLLLAAVLSLVDRKLGERRHDRVLLNLGASPGSLARVGAGLFAVPYAATVVLGGLTGLVLCMLLLDAATPPPWRFISSVTVPVLALGLVGTWGVAVLGARSAVREPE